MWSHKKKTFQNILEFYLDRSTKTTDDMRGKRLEEGNRFLLNLEILRNRLKPINDEFWVGFLDTAKDCIMIKDSIMDRSNKNKHLLLHAYQVKLEQEVSKKAHLIHQQASRRSYFDVFFITSGFGLTITPFILLKGFLAGTFALSLGPWGLAALSVGLLFTGIVIAAVAAFSFSINRGLIKDKQIKEIATYVESITSKKLRQEDRIDGFEIPSITLNPKLDPDDLFTQEEAIGSQAALAF